MNVLVTGAAGYIGSHAVKRLLADGHAVVGLDNFSVGPRGSVDVLRRLPGAHDRLSFVEADIADQDKVEETLSENAIDSVMHFAAYADVRESMRDPLKYYLNNTASAIRFLETCDAADVERFVFSSTCATYGELTDDDVPVTEAYPHRKPINPYGWSKLALELALEDHAAACARRGKPFAMAILRYFNVAGADTAGLLGEDRSPQIRIIPILIEAAMGRREKVSIFGTDYPTPDGTCIRDYIHVDDLVAAHAMVLAALEPGERRVYNLGLGHGVSVRELIDATKRVTGADFPVEEGPRAAGDPAMLYCDPSAIQREVVWKPEVDSLDEIIRTAWQWMRDHPNGYASQ